MTNRAETKTTEWSVWAYGPYAMTLIGTCKTEADALRLAATPGARLYGEVRVDRRVSIVTPVADFAAMTSGGVS